jgi:hypothetical protein
MAVVVAASAPCHISMADDDRKRELEVVARCLYRDAPAFFGHAGSLEKVIAWNAEHTAADVTIEDGPTVLATYRVAESNKVVEVFSKVHSHFPDSATDDRHSRMISACLFEAGYESILINKKD